MSMYRYTLIVFLTFSNFILVSQEKEKRALVAIKNVVSRWKPYNSQNAPATIPAPRIFTQTELEKQKIISKFLGKKECSEADIPLLKKWDHTYCTLLIEHPEFMNFIAYLSSSNNARGLHLMSATLDKAGVALATLKPHELDRALTLQKKALTISHLIMHMKNADPAVKRAVKAHLLYIKQHEPALVSYYKQLQRACHELRVIHAPHAQNVTFPHLGWLPEDKSLSNLMPVVAAPVISENTMTNNAIPIVPIEQEKEDLETLEKRYKRLNKHKDYEGALKTAWKVVQEAPEESSYFKNAKKLVELYASKHNNAIAHCILCYVEKKNPEKSINHFMQAQILRPGTLTEYPEKTDKTVTLATLMGQGTLVKWESDNEPSAHARETVLNFSKTHPTLVNIAMAVYYYKNAFCNPTRQLVCLQTAKECVDTLPRDVELVPDILTGTDINFYYYQQLYAFARDEKNYSVLGIVPLNNFLMATAHLGQAYQGLKLYSLPMISGVSYYEQAIAAFKRNCLLIREIIEKQIEKNIQKADQEYEKILPYLQKNLLFGADGIPLSLEQRRTICTFLIQHPEHPDRLTQSLVTGTYEGSPYEYVANTSKESRADIYFRMLFAIDRGDYACARTLAQEGMRHNAPFTAMYFKNILFRTDDILKTDAQKYTAIKNFLGEMVTAPSKSNFALYCDAITTLEQMRQREFLPAFGLLIEQNCTEWKVTTPLIQKNNSTQKLVTLIADAQSIFPQKPITEQELLLNEQTLHLLTHYCVNNKTLDPLYQYVQLIIGTIKNAHLTTSSLESLASSPTTLARYQSLLYKVSEYLTFDINQNRETSTFWAGSKTRLDLVETLESILANNKLVGELRENGLHQHIVTLYYLFNPYFDTLN